MVIKCDFQAQGSVGSNLDALEPQNHVTLKSSLKAHTLPYGLRLFEARLREV